VKGYFIRPAITCKSLFIKAFCVLVLNGCVTQAPAPILQSGDFELRGKLSVKDHDAGFSARFVWLQEGDTFDVQLWGPLGQGRMRLHGDADALVIVDARGETIRQGPPEAVMRAELGWAVPIRALVHWSRGAPAPGLLVTDERRDSSGRLLGFAQLGWAVAFEDHRAVEAEPAAAWLPARITAQRPGQRVLMVLSQWRL